MINVDKIEGGLPISVIIPLSRKREDFFYNMVYPLIEANNPNEIIVVNDDKSAPYKRNIGFGKSTQPYIFFCDDDILLPSNHLQKLHFELSSAIDSVGYTYSGYNGIVLNPSTHPMRGNFKIETIDFNIQLLQKSNFISTMSLIKRDVFPGFDESLKRLQDWDLWLTLLKKGYYGKAVHNNEFYAYYLDEGITSNGNSLNDGHRKIIEKHNLIV